MCMYMLFPRIGEYVTFTKWKQGCRKRRLRRLEPFHRMMEGASIKEFNDEKRGRRRTVGFEVG